MRRMLVADGVGAAQGTAMATVVATSLVVVTLAASVGSGGNGDYDDGAAARFCAFDCSRGGRPSSPGRCFNARHVFDTRGLDWVMVPTRDETMEPGDKSILPEWTELKAANMTWEGWFRMTDPPAADQTLFGTYGANHDYAGGDEGPAFMDGADRRRHASVVVHPSGELSLQTNVGGSSGTVKGAVSLADGEWHHVAATFMDVGGAQLAISVRVKWVDVRSINNRPEIRNAIYPMLKETVAEIAGSGTVASDITVALADALVKPTPVFWEYAFRATFRINSRPEAVAAKLAELTAKDRIAEKVAATVRAVPDIWIAIADPDYFVEDIEADLEDVELLPVTSAGGMMLYVDGFPGAGWINYAPQEDNVGMDGQLVLCGGKVETTMGCQASRFRLWSLALSVPQMRAVQPCTLPSLAEVIGGPFPHGLRASFDLDGGYANSAPGSTYPTAEGGLAHQATQSVTEDGTQEDPPEVTGGFERGGPCHSARCPLKSPDTGCPLIAGKELRFNSVETCAEYSNLHFCRLAGPSRGRPAVTGLGGCHAGGPIAAQGQPLGWRVEFGENCTGADCM